MKKLTSSVSRRNFLKSSALLGAFTVLPAGVVLGARSGRVRPNDKINLAVVGIGNQGNGIRKQFVGSGLCEVVALCDVDLDGAHTAESLADHPNAKRYRDFRKMFDEMADEIDAVIVGTPDHSHFAVTILAMSLGKHVFVEKPLAHTFGQCERLIRMANKHPELVTQMGNQGFSGANYFQFKAWREAGIIKDVTRITAHMNMGRRWHPWDLNLDQVPATPAPAGIDWAQWLDVVAAERPFSDKLHPGNWRGWYEFGCGALGDWGPHLIDSAHHFLHLGLPQKITAVERRGVNPANLIFPRSSTLRFDFAARGADLPACALTWYDGTDNHPPVESEYDEVEVDSASGATTRTPVAVNRPGKIIYSKELVFQGGSHGSALRIIPRAKLLEMRDALPDVPRATSNQYVNFLRAIRGEEETRSPFSISGPLSQVLTLGVLSQIFGGELTFDPVRKQITNNSAANTLLDPAPRRGWEYFYQLHG